MIFNARKQCERELVEKKPNNNIKYNKYNNNNNNNNNYGLMRNIRPRY